MKDKIDLGCGEDKPKGFFGVDQLNTEDTDKVIDLDNQDWDLPSNHFRYAQAKDLFEHLDKPVNFMEELYRILEPGGEAYIRGPHLASNNWTDPTHKRLLGHQTIDFYFTENGLYSYYSDAEFSVRNKKITFEKRKLMFYNYVVESLVNLNDFTRSIYENTFVSSLFPSKNIEFTIRKMMDIEEDELK